MSTKTKTKKTKKGSKRSTYKGGSFFKLFQKTNPLQEFINMFDERLQKNKSLLNIMANINNFTDNLPDTNQVLNDIKNLNLSDEEKIKQSLLILYLLMFILYARIQKSSSAKLQGDFYKNYPLGDFTTCKNNEIMKSLNKNLDELGKITVTLGCSGCFDRAHFILIGQGIKECLSEPNKRTFNENLVKEIKTLKELDLRFDFMPIFEEITLEYAKARMDAAFDDYEIDRKNPRADTTYLDEAIKKWIELIDTDEKYEAILESYKKDAAPITHTSNNSENSSERTKLNKKKRKADLIINTLTNKYTKILVEVNPNHIKLIRNE